MRSVVLAFSLLISLIGCTTHPVGNTLQHPLPTLPYDAWEIGLLAPNYMEAWVESVDVLDQRGIGYYRVHGGVAAIQNPPDNRGNPRGWPARPGAGKTRPMTNIDLLKSYSCVGSHWPSHRPTGCGSIHRKLSERK